MEPIGVRVFNVETKEMIGNFDSYLAASKFVGCEVGFLRTAHVSKCRIYKNKLGFPVCIRSVKQVEAAD